MEGVIIVVYTPDIFIEILPIKLLQDSKTSCLSTGTKYSLSVSLSHLRTDKDVFYFSSGLPSEKKACR